jgi:hypothetical protein
MEKIRGNEPVAELKMEACIFDRYHYNLLKNHPSIDKVYLENTWAEWRNRGIFFSGDTQRRSQIYMAYYLATHCQMYAEIQCGLYGSLDEMDAFQKNWYAEARQEIADKGDDWKDWTVWSDVVDMEGGASIPLREPYSILHSIANPSRERHPDYYLRNKIWSDDSDVQVERHHNGYLRSQDVCNGGVMDSEG